MRLGNFSVKLTVKDIAASARVDREARIQSCVGGDQAKNW